MFRRSDGRRQASSLVDQLVDAVADRNFTELRREYLQLLGEVHGYNTLACDGTDFQEYHSIHEARLDGDVVSPPQKQ